MLKGIIQFIKSRTFFKHLAIYIVSLSLLIWALLFWLRSATNHGQAIKVPDFSSVKLADLDRFVSDKNVRYLVIDSIYDIKSPKGTVVKQEPEPGAEVKKNRIIFLYVTSVMPPRIQMPKLIDCSLRQALSMITTYGLKAGKQKFVPDQCANCILDQLVKGKKIAPGEMIEKGTVIDLIVGKGLSDEEVNVPCLSGLTKKEALAKLAESSLSIGAVTYDDPKDSSSVTARVFRQSPSCAGERSINMGATVDIYLTSDKNKIRSAGDDADDDTGDDGGFNK